MTQNQRIRSQNSVEIDDYITHTRVDIKLI